jgi:hypothetical protein
LTHPSWGQLLHRPDLLANADERDGDGAAVAAVAEDDGGGGDHDGHGCEVEAVPLGDAVAKQRADDEEREAPEKEIRDRVPLQLHVHPADGERDHGLRRIGGEGNRSSALPCSSEKKGGGTDGRGVRGAV